MRAGLAVLIVVVMSRPELARSQSDLEEARPIPIHPGVTTMLQLPDEIVHTWIVHQGEIRVARRGNEVAIRPHAGTRAGVEASLKVETGTIHRTFRLRVVARAKDASRNVLVLAANAERDMEEPAPPAPPVKPAKPAAPKVRAKPAAPVAPAVGAKPAEPATPAVRAKPAEPAPPVGEALAASAPPPAPPAEPEPATATDTAADTEHHTTIDIESATRAAGAPGFDLSVQAVLGLGFTGVNIAGYEPETALQSHRSLGLRLTGEPRNTWWSLEANISGEWHAGPMLYRRAASELLVSGPRLRSDVGLRASVGTKWRASSYVGIGMHVHLRRTHKVGSAPESTMEQGAVLVLGMGLQHRFRHGLLLGVDVHIRQGGPDDYHSVAALLTLGRFLDQGE